MFILKLLNHCNKCLNKGFTLFELIIVVIIVGISATVGIVNLMGQKQQQEANTALLYFNSSLQKAQANANRLSISCTVNINETSDYYTISGNPQGCLQETLTINKNNVKITQDGQINPPWTISFNFLGTTQTEKLFFIGRTNNNDNDNCLIVSSPLGLIRTGKKENNNCINIENLRYDNEN